MLTIKALHIFFMVGWFAGLFYLPRLFVNHAMVSDAATRERLAMMERKLFYFMSPLGVLALVFGVWLWRGGYGFDGAWIHVKLLLAVVLVLYHLYCGWLMRQLAASRDRHSHVWFRVFNELPVLVLIAATFLAVMKPSF